ncbi:MAG: LPS export ABC transporter periplasmic protein LptC, partial [Bryobacteraceae bacterium]|nr:LPS export ABC transporter periplasmic protein LptC [Bryobacteraceae bacterium]
MRLARWLVLLVIVAIVAGVGFFYNAQRAAQARNAPKAPAKLPEAVSARANDWAWERTRDGRPLVRVWARDMKANAEATQLELSGVTLHLFHKDAKSFDKVTSAKAEFDLPQGLLFSDGEVVITMGVPAEGEQPAPSGRLVTIKTSGVHFESKTGKVSTERAASFLFDRGEGQSTGAQYDPETRELGMHTDVKLKWRGEN